MSSTVRGPQRAVPLETYIKKIQSVFDMHRVEFGAPENLPPFLKRLREDRHLAMDFWALTAAISTSEGADLPHEQMLEIVVRGVTLQDPSELRQSGDDELTQTLDDLGRLLAGVDLDSPPPEEEHHRPVSTQDNWPPHPKTLFAQQPATVSSRIRSVPPIDKPAEPVFDEPFAESPAAKTAPSDEPLTHHVKDVAPEPSQKQGIARDHTPGPASPTTVSKRELDDALSRLEMNSHTLRLHLENIDSRMSRIEPHLEELALKATSPPANETPQVNGARSEDYVSDSGFGQSAPDDRPDLNLNRSSNLGSSPRLVLRADDDDDPSIHVPLSGYERARAGRVLPLFLAFLLIVGGLYVVQRMYGAELRERYGPTLQALFRQTYDALAGKVNSLRHSSNKQQAANASSSEDHSADPMSSTSSPSEESLHSAPAPNPAPTAATPDAGATQDESQTPPAPSPTPAPAAASPATSVANSVAPVSSPAAPVAHLRNEPSRREAAVERASRVPTDAGDFTRASGHYNPAEIPVNVPPAVMQENLITSRVPAYPQAAKAEGVEGLVVMQAIISKYGTVDQLHVIQGDPLLRAAASEAVSKWHYRPYMVSGRPVDVSTTVKVEFRLPRE